MSKLLKNRNFLRIVVILLFACFLGTAMSFLFNNIRKNSAQAALTGSGTQADPVKIYNVADLQQFQTNVNNGTDTYDGKYVKLMADIDMSSISNWTPIGNNPGAAPYAKAFHGHFDGGGKTISNLVINSTSAYTGLFGLVAGATIENLTISNPDVYSTKTNVGALVGYFYAGDVTINKVVYERKGAITNCHVLGGWISSASSEVGGIVGRLNAANNVKYDHAIEVKDCTVKGTGNNYEPTNVWGTYNVGGIAGLCTGVTWKELSTTADQAGVHIAVCSSTATVTASTGSSGAGGIIGNAAGLLIEECYSTGAVRGRHGGYAGGVVGRCSTKGLACKIQNCFAMGDVTVTGVASGDKSSDGHAHAGGIVGGLNDVISYVLNCYYTGRVIGCTLWSYNGGYYSATGGGIVGQVSGASSVIGGCAVASDRVLGVCQGNAAAGGLSSPLANGWSAVYPTMLSGSKNIYYKDVLLAEQHGNKNYPVSISIKGDKVDLAAFKDINTYLKDTKHPDGLGWSISGGNRVWGIGQSFNNGFPYLSNFKKNSTNIEYPYGSIYNPIIISTPDDFQEMADNVNSGSETYDSLYIKQTADLDMTGIDIVGNVNGTGSGTYRDKTFRGTYDGGMYRLQNVKIVGARNNIAIFGATMNATFKNIIVEDGRINNETGTQANAGILVGISWGCLYMENCAMLGGQVAAKNMSYVGGLAGHVQRTGNFFIKCFSSAEVIGKNSVGGLIGLGYGIHMSQCFCTGNVGNKDDNTEQIKQTWSTGGLIGSLYKPYNVDSYTYDETATANYTTNTAYSTIDNCYAMGKIVNLTYDKNHNAAGGLVGKAWNGTKVTNSYFYGDLVAGGSPTAAYTANAGGIIGVALAADVEVNNCLSVIKTCELKASGNLRVMGYYTTYKTTIPQSPVNCYYVPVDNPPTDVTTGAGGAINGGQQTTLADVASGKIFGSTYSISNDDGSTTTVDGLNWNMTDIWMQKATVNDGFPMLKGLIVDTTELDAIIAEARTYDASQYSEETYSVLAKLMDAAKKEIAEHTITEESKLQYMEAILKAIDGLRPDTAKLQELVERVKKDMLPYKEFYVSFTLVDSLMPGAEEILENPDRFYNNDVQSTYEALKLAVDNLRVDKTKLNKAIERANAIMLNASSYPENQIKTLDAALKAAVTVNNDVTVLAPQVNNATKNLEEALEGVQLDKTGLLNQIIESYAYIGVVVKYDVALGDTEKSIMVENDNNRVMSLELKNYAEFEKALENAEQVLYNSEAPSQSILNAMFDLDVAKNALKLKTDKLEELSSQAAALLLNEKYYTADSIAKLKTEKATADAIIEATATTDTMAKRRDDYDASCKSLTAALKVEINKTELMQTITRAKAENKNELYTDETYNKLQEEITKAQAVYDNANATVKEVYAAISALNDALQNLDISLDYLKDLIKQARYILDNAAVKALYTTGIDELDNRTGKAEELCKINASELNVTDVKTTTRLLEAALNALTVSKDEMNRYIRMALTDYADDYVKDGVYTEESTEEFRILAQNAMNERDTMTDAEVVSYTIRLKNAYENLKANSDALAALVNEISAMSNKKYRQDNDGKWIVDEDTGNMKLFVIYEDKSWKVLETELAKAKELLLNLKATPTQINDSIAALTAAKEGLIVDTSELELRMKKAEGLLEQEDLYTEDSLANLQEAYDAAKELLDGAKESGEKLALKDVQERLDALLLAMESMEADLNAVYELLDIAKNLLGYKEYFTKVTGDKLKSSYDQVNSLIENGAELDASSVSVLAQLLTDSMKELVITTDALQKFVDIYDDLVEDKAYLINFAAFEGYIKQYRNLLKPNKLKITTYTEAQEQIELYTLVLGALTSTYTALEPNWPAYEDLVSDGKGILNKAQQVEGTNTEDLEAALTDADDLLADKPATYTEMLASVHSLKSALQALKSLELAELIQTTKETMASEVIEIDGDETELSGYYGNGATVANAYTSVSYKVLQSAIKNGEAVLKISNPSYDAVEGAITAIENAVTGLVVDPALLNFLIKECEELYDSDYYETEDNANYDFFVEKLDACKTVVATPTTTLENYLKAYNDLIEAKKWLDFKSNVLADIIAVAEKKIADDGAKCTAASVAALQAQITSAKACTATSGSTDYNDACNALLDAIANLTYIDELQKEITRVQPFVDYGNPDEVGNYYSDGSFQELKDLLDGAKALVTKEDLRQFEVDSMVTQLKVCDDKEDGLLLVVTEEKKFVDAQKAFIEKNEGMYTDDTWTPYVAAVDKFDSLIKLPKHEVTTEQIAEAKKDIEDTFNELEKDLNRKFTLKESNKTFLFVYDDGSAVNYPEHQYAADKPIYLTNIALNDSIADILTQFDNSDVKAFNAKGEEITDMAAQVVATGIVLRVMAGDQILDELILVLRGDINGDGRITAVDQSQLNTHVKGLKQLTGAYLRACDVNGDSKVSAVDQSQLNTHVKGLKKLYEGLSVKGAA